MELPGAERDANGGPSGTGRTWAHKFYCSFKGLKAGIRGHSSFSVHFFMTVAVICMAQALQCDLIEWAILVLCVGGVMVSELFNSAIEELVRSMPAGERQRFWPALDMAAGAVLGAAIFASLIGLMIFGNRFLALWLAQFVVH